MALPEAGQWPVPPNPRLQRVIRALFAGVQALEDIGLSRRPRDQTTTSAAPRLDLPPKAGASWTTEEDQRLRDEYQNEKNIDTLAVLHGRSRGAITARLVRIRLLERPPLEQPRGPARPQR